MREVVQLNKPGPMATTLADAEWVGDQVTHKSHLLPQGPAGEESVAIGCTEAHFGGCGRGELGNRVRVRIGGWGRDDVAEAGKRHRGSNALLGRNDVSWVTREVLPQQMNGSESR